jgi:hypothetical protein
MRPTAVRFIRSPWASRQWRYNLKAGVLEAAPAERSASLWSDSRCAAVFATASPAGKPTRPLSIRSWSLRRIRWLWTAICLVGKVRPTTCAISARDAAPGCSQRTPVWTAPENMSCRWEVSIKLETSLLSMRAGPQAANLGCRLFTCLSSPETAAATDLHCADFVRPRFARACRQNYPRAPVGWRAVHRIIGGRDPRACDVVADHKVSARCEVIRRIE